ncbi:TBC domain-containing protein kinase-like protein [Mercenaria mercenaria]|uniref:TBC domain-containing protein kinase-like protein n=1 Tax=Mercenaria mercenaria TaxID=6596 RepID=UPI00234F749E|nr:TBC domain-containing protein kinase-like protein [Mercenaria mercenaria]XP_053402000.1 TBC domain-containing protein kinase-like protein [Mercenaria mercenaria]
MALGKAQFGVSTFFAASHSNDKCGANGLPLTPNSIKIVGRFQHLKTLDHTHICKYLDCVRGRHERLIFVQEHHTNNLNVAWNTGKYQSEEKLIKLAFEILQGLVYLNKNGVCHRNLKFENILFDSEDKVKLSDYGMYYMSNSGAYVSFPIGQLNYTSPEVLCCGPVQTDEETELSTLPTSSPKVDVWSLGIILLELLSAKRIWADTPLQEIVKNILKFLQSDCDPFDYVVNELKCDNTLKAFHPSAVDFLRKCLIVDPKHRPSPSELLHHEVFILHKLQQMSPRNGFHLFTTKLRCKDLELPTLTDSDKDYNPDHLSERSMEEVYYLWRLAGGDLEAVLKKVGMIKAKPPVTILPSLTLDNGEVLGQGRDQMELLDHTVVLLSQDQLRQRLADIDEKAYYPLLEDDQMVEEGLPTSPSNVDIASSASLPLIIREKDIEHQFHRVILYERLIKGYPYKKAHIWKEARVDIPPLFRNLVWAALLEVEGDIQAEYDAIDKETPTGTDRQIAVDIPRCHQYHELLASPTAHAKFKRVLKAWVVSHPEYVYWQGLDSLCAPFLALNFNNEALAYACIKAFIPKYLHKFFLKDNSPVIQEYLAVFSHLIAFHEPELSNHMEGIGFIPDLYAIPWFLTMFAHVFPLNKIVHLWDTLLLGNSSFPLCIGVAILKQFHDRLLSYGFNECILLFSDMPVIDLQQCVKDSIQIFCNTPKSATYRQHARQTKKKPETRPNVSYYSRDYNEQPTNDLSMEPLTLDELKSEKCPRISAEDLMELGEFSGNGNSRSPTKKKPNTKPLLLVIDVRSPDEYKRGTVPGSLNIPFQTAFSPEGDLVACPAVTTLKQSKSQVKVVFGSRGRNASNFANELMRLGYIRVCTLHKGIDVLRQTGILTVPPADI